MNLHAILTGTKRENRDGTSRQRLIAQMRDDEQLFLQDAASERAPFSIAVLNYDNQTCGFLERELAQAIRETYLDIDRVPVYVAQIVTDHEGYYQCKVEFGIPEDSPTAKTYFSYKGYEPGKPVSMESTPAVQEHKPTQKDTKKKGKTPIVPLVFLAIALVGIVITATTGNPSESLPPTILFAFIAFAWFMAAKLRRQWKSTPKDAAKYEIDYVTVVSGHSRKKAGSTLARGVTGNMIAGPIGGLLLGSTSKHKEYVTLIIHNVNGSSHMVKTTTDSMQFRMLSRYIR